MRLAMLAALAGLFGFAGPALALDKVKFGTNWLADPAAGGFFQAAADGTYAQYGLDVTIIPGGPQANGALLLLYGKLEFYMGSDMIGNFLAAEAKVPLIAVAADFQKSPQALMSHPGVGMDNWEDLPRAKPVSISALPRSPHSTPGSSSNTASRTRTFGRTISTPPLSSRTRIRSSRATSQASPSSSKSRAISCRTYSCSSTMAMTPTRP